MIDNEKQRWTNEKFFFKLPQGMSMSYENLHLWFIEETLIVYFDLLKEKTQKSFHFARQLHNLQC